MNPVKTICLLILVIGIPVFALDDSNSAELSLEEFENLKSFRIRGGSEAELGWFPYQVEIRRQSDDFFLCGGVLVGTALGGHVVLTTASCISVQSPENRPTPVEDAKTFKVIAGRVDRITPGKPYQRRNAGLIFRHPDWKDHDTRINDIAVIYPSSPFTESEFVKPIQLAKPANGAMRPPDGSELTVSGWGVTGFAYPDEEYPRILQFVDMPLISIWDCKNKYDYVYKKHWVHDSVFCLWKDADTGPFRSDWGGPATFPDDDGLPVLWGIYSRGAQDYYNPRKIIPPIFTNIRYFTSFIEKYGDPCFGKNNTALARASLSYAPQNDEMFEGKYVEPGSSSLRHASDIYAKPEEAGFIAEILYKGLFFCHGSVYTSMMGHHIVITAALCVTDPHGHGTIKPSDLQIVAGRLNRDDTSTGQTRRVKHVVRNQAWRMARFHENNLGLIFLDKKFENKGGFGSISLPQEEFAYPKSGTKLKILGWGYGSHAGPTTSQKLQVGTFGVISPKDCLNNKMHSGNLCAGLIKDGRPPGVTGMGSPAVLTDPSTGEAYLAGILTSEASKPPDKQRATVYTRISYFLSWIRETSSLCGQ